MFTFVRCPGYGYETLENLTVGMPNWRFRRADTYIGTGPGVAWGFAHATCLINKRQAVCNATNKARARRLMHKAGVPVPAPWNGKGAPTFPLVARPDYHHHGNDLYIINNWAELDSCPIQPGGGYFSSLFNKDGEVRVHCGHGKVLVIEDKPLVCGEVRANQHITKAPWLILKWEHMKRKTIKRACRAALAAMDAVGLDFGGVDVMINETTGEVAVCEVNTAPTMAATPMALDKYRRYFLWLERRNLNAPHWPWHNYQRGLSLLWKNFQLDDTKHEEEV